uniref:NADPH oxidase 4 n=1 Tax=Ciona intestinalis TaxID=7719 RepID=F6YS00_CIOIN
MQLKNYLVNDGLRLFIWVAWISINASLFYFTFMYYYNGIQFYYLHQMLGYGLCISRASAACINLNSSFILFPMCRGLVTFMRGLPRGVGRQVRRLLDRGRSFHILCGYILCLLAGVHCAAHAYNAVYFSKYYNSRYKDLNVAKYSNQNPLLMLVTSLSGITGILLVISLVVISAFASRPIRRNNHNKFWKTHHIFIVFYALIFIHAMDGVIKYQTNVDQHKPGCFIIIDQTNNTSNISMVQPEPEPFPNHPSMVKPKMVAVPEPPHGEPFPNMKLASKMPSKTDMKFMNNTAPQPHHVIMPEPEPMPHKGAHGAPNTTRIFVHGSWVEVMECVQPPPKFSSCGQEAWLWLCAPLIIYVIERIGRHFRSSHDVTTIVKFIEHPCDVIELRLYRNGFSAKPGQCIWVRCPQLSKVESHPFSLTSVPSKDDPTFGIHVKLRGDWTEELRDLMVRELNPVVEISKDKIIAGGNFLEKDDELSNRGETEYKRNPNNSQYLATMASPNQSINKPCLVHNFRTQETDFQMHCTLSNSTISLYDNHEMPTHQENIDDQTCKKTSSTCLSQYSLESESQRNLPKSTTLHSKDQQNLQNETTLYSEDQRNVPKSTALVSEACSTKNDIHLPCNQTVSKQLPILCVEGPTGGAMEDIFKYKISMCVAGGIGVTPYASVLNALLKDEDLFSRMKLKRLYLIWSCKDPRSFSWFASLIRDVQIVLWKRNCPDLLSVRLHITGSNTLQSEESGDQLLSDIQGCHVAYGRPDVTQVFEEIRTAAQYQRSTVGVFCCGHRLLVSSVKHHCLKTKSSKVKFLFNKEAF